MTLQVADWVIPLFFLAALVLLVRFRRQLQAEDKESYTYIGAGLVLLALVSVSRVYFVDGYFSGIPFLSDALFYRITSWIVIIIGATLIVSGMATWLPIARHLRTDNDRKIKRLELVKQLEQLISLDYRPDELLKNTLVHMVEQLDLVQGVVYRYSAARGEAILTGVFPSAGSGLVAASLLKLTQAEAQEISDGSATEIVERVQAALGISAAPHVAVPIIVDLHLAGFFLLWPSRETPLSPDQNAVLKLAADVLARKISLERARVEANYYHRLASLQRGLERISSSGNKDSEAISALLREVRTALNADLVAMWIVSKGEDFFTRYSIGEAGSLLLEKGLPVPAGYYELKETKDNHPILLNSAPGGPAGVRALLGGEFDCGIAAPVLDTVERSVMLVLGARGDMALTPAATRLLKSHMDAIRRVTATALGVNRPVRVDRSLLRLNRIWSSFQRTGDLTELFQHTAQLLTRVLPVDVVRISTTDLAGQYLTSQALGGSNDLDRMTPPNGRMIRSLMPCHEKAIRSGRIVSAVAGEPNGLLVPAESTQLLNADLCFLAVVPIPAAHGANGVISLGQVEGSGSFGLDRQQLLLARTAAQGLGFALATADRSSGLFQDGRSSEPEDLRNDFALRSRVKSSLSGIFGSVELLKAQQESPDPQMNRYLTIIDRSARRINEYIDPQEINSTFK